MRLMSVRWEVLLDAHQGALADEPDLHPMFCTDSGEVSCAALMDDEALERAIPVPSKGWERGLEQRKRFAAALCDATLRASVEAALAGGDPFRAFDAALEGHPIEWMRWIEEERLADVQHLCAWLRRAGIEPDPAPGMSRKIIEFPVRKESV